MKLYEIFQTGECVHLAGLPRLYQRSLAHIEVMELCSGGTLAEILVPSSKKKMKT